MPFQLGMRTCRAVKLLKRNTVRSFNRRIYLNQIGREQNGEKINQVDESAIKQKLTASSITFVNGYTCLCIEGCPFCHKDKKNDKKSKSNEMIYINKTTGYTLCNKCKGTGSWNTVSELLEKSEEKKTKEKIKLSEKLEKYEKGDNVWEDAVIKNTISLHELDDDEYYNAFRKFNFILCSKDLAKKLEIRITKDMSKMYLPLFSFDFTIVGYKIIHSNGSISTVPSNDCPGFLKSDFESNESKKAVIVAEVSDFFALASQNLLIDVLCLPHGVLSLPQISLPFLEKYTSLILWLGGPSKLDVTRTFANKLNNKRCFIVKPISQQSSAVTSLAKGENILKILNDAKSAWHDSIITFTELRDEVLAELQNKDHYTGIPWTRYPVLNRILKGHRRGELTILTGPTGSGKTTFMSEYSLDLAMQGVNTLWGSFEIKNVRLAKRMLQQFCRQPLEENLESYDYWANKFEQLPIYFMTFHGQQPLKVVMDAVEHSSYVHDIAHVIIDNVQFMIDISLNSAGMDRFWRQDVLIQAFRSFASKCNCHVTLVMHPKKGMDGIELTNNSIFGGAKAAQEADNILIIQNLNSTSGINTKKKVLEISKNRYAGQLGTMPLVFNTNSYGFSKFTGDSVVSVDRADEVDVNPENEDNWEDSEDSFLNEDEEREKRDWGNWDVPKGWNKLMNA